MDDVEVDELVEEEDVVGQVDVDEVVDVEVVLQVVVVVGQRTSPLGVFSRWFSCKGSLFSLIKGSSMRFSFSERGSVISGSSTGVSSGSTAGSVS